VLTTSELDTHLRRVTYKPGWSFTVYDGRWEGQHLVIRVVTPDAFAPSDQVTLDIHSALPPMDTPGQFDRWLMWRLGRIECHEMREWYRVDGRPASDPHASGAEHDVEY
jgi:hypothetical protein